MYYIQFQLDLTTLLKQTPPFAFLTDEKKKRLCLNCFMPWKLLQPELLDYSILFCLVNCVFKCEHPFIDKLMVITEPVEPSARQLRLCSKLHVYPSNVQRMLHTNLPRFMQNLSKYAKIE